MYFIVENIVWLFKSYYVVWKLSYLSPNYTILFSLNRTM